MNDLQNDRLDTQPTDQNTEFKQAYVLSPATIET